MPDILSYSLTNALSQTTINQVGGINASATSLTVASTTGHPATPFDVMVDSELLTVTGVAGNALTISRAAQLTTAAAHANGAAVYVLMQVWAPVVNVKAKIVDSATQKVTSADYTAGFNFAVIVPGLSVQDHIDLVTQIANWVLMRKAGLG